MDPQQLIDTFQALSNQIKALQAEILSLKQDNDNQPQISSQNGATSSTGEKLTLT